MIEAHLILKWLPAIHQSDICADFALYFFFLQKERWEGGLKMVPCLGAREFLAKIPMALIELEAARKRAVSVLSPRFEENAVTSARAGGEIKREMKM